VSISKILVAVLSVLALLYGSSATAAQVSGGPPDIDPVAGPIEVFVTVSQDAIVQGGFGSGDIAIVNSDAQASAVVAVRATLRFSDGSRQQMQLPNPVFLDPDSAFVFLVSFPVPQDAPPGPAELSVTAYVGRVGGQGGGGPATYARPLIARDADTFDVVAP
jgi:hypothetical protein